METLYLAPQVAHGHMAIPFRCGNALMPHKNLYAPQVGPGIKHVRCEGMAHHVRMDMTTDSGLLRAIIKYARHGKARHSSGSPGGYEDNILVGHRTLKIFPFLQPHAQELHNAVIQQNDSFFTAFAEDGCLLLV